MSVVLTKDQAEIFLTDFDFEKIEASICKSNLEATFFGDTSTPCILIRHKFIKLFDVLEMMRTL